MKSPPACLLIFFFSLTGLFAGEIETTYLDPEEYTDLDFVDRSSKTSLKTFDRELKKSGLIAALVGDERKLQIAFSDINMAGKILPLKGFDEIRVIRSVYPPVLEFKYSILDLDGEVLDSGEESITDLAFQDQLGRKSSSQTFFYELELLEDWLRKKNRG